MKHFFPANKYEIKHGSSVYVCVQKLAAKMYKILQSVEISQNKS